MCHHVVGPAVRTDLTQSQLRNCRGVPVEVGEGARVDFQRAYYDD
jgi:hypothetical protein